MSCLTSTSQLMMKGKRIEWECDVCRVAKFATFQEAYRHEQNCKGPPPATSDINSSFQHSTNINSKANINEKNEKQTKRSIQASLNFPQRSRRKTRRKEQKKTNFYTQIEEEDESFQVIDMNTTPQQANYFKSSKNSKSYKIRLKTGAKNTNGDIPSDPVLQKKQKKICKEVRSLKASSTVEAKNSVPLASIFVSRKERQKLTQSSSPKQANHNKVSVGEHLAVEYFVKRKLEAAKQKEKRLRKSDDKNTKPVASIFHIGARRDMSINGDRFDDSSKWKEVDGQPILFFPNNSHVIQDYTPAEQIETHAFPIQTAISPLLLKKLSTALIRYPRYSFMKNVTPDLDPLKLQFKKERTSVPRNHLHELFSQTFSTARNFKQDPELLSQKYTFKTSHLKHNSTAQHLISFLRPYERRLVASQTPCSHWLSDENYSDSDMEEESKIYILTGPTSSGKTSLVYACAEYFDCFHVLEVNSSIKRGGSSLKNAVEEATLSHSSVSLMNEVDGSDKKKTKMSLILIDEVDVLFSDNGDAGFWPSLYQLSKNSKCPIILTSTFLPSSLPQVVSNFEHGELSLPSVLECSEQLIKTAKLEGMKIICESGCKTIAEMLRCDMRKILLELQCWALGVDKMKKSSRPESSSSKEIFQNHPCVQRPKIASISPRILPANKITTILIQGKFSHPLHTKLNVRINSKSVMFQKLSDTTLIAAVPPPNLPAGVNCYGLYDDSQLECSSCCYNLIEIEIVQKDGIVIRNNEEFRVEFSFPRENLGPSNEGYVGNLKGENKGLEKTFENEVGTVQSFIAKSDTKNDIKMKASTKSASPFESNKQILRGKKLEDRISDTTTKHHQEKKDSSEQDDCFTSTMVSHFTKETSELEGDVCKKNLNILSKQRIEETIINYKNENKTSPENANTSEDIHHSEVVVYPTETLQHQLNEIATLERHCREVSDAIFAEDYFESLSLPSLSGPVQGIGNFSQDDKRSKTNQTAPKMSKPPSFDRLFSLSHSTSPFFYGCTDAMMYRPMLKRERQLLALEAISCSHDDLNLGLDDVEIDKCSVSFGMSRTISPLPHFLSNDTESLAREESLNKMFILLKYLRWKKCKDTIPLMKLLVSNTGAEKMNSFCFGAGHDVKNFINSVSSAFYISDCLDNRLILDYLPTLRSMSFAEEDADHEYAKVKIENSKRMIEDSSRRSTRRTAKLGRRHYFEFLMTYMNSKSHEQWTGKRVGSYLSRHAFDKRN